MDSRPDEHDRTVLPRRIIDLVDEQEVAGDMGFAMARPLAFERTVVPLGPNRRGPAPHDRVKYRWRNLIERLFNKLKNWRRMATCDDKTAQCYLSFVNLASALLWLSFVHMD